MDKELKYFKSIVKLAVKYSKKQSPEISELKNDLKALKEGYKHLEGIVESVEEMVDGKNEAIINELTLRQKNLESNYESLVRQRAESAKSPAHENPKNDIKEYTVVELQKLCGYKSAQTLYNRFKSNSLSPNKRKEGLKVFYQLSSKELDILKGSSTHVSEDGKDWYYKKEVMKVLGISSYQTFVNRTKANKLKIQTKRDGQKVLKYLPPEILEKLSQDGRMPQPAGKLNEDRPNPAEKKKII